jgi:hypothetical protein
MGDKVRIRIWNHSQDNVDRFLESPATRSIDMDKVGAIVSWYENLSEFQSMS